MIIIFKTPININIMNQVKSHIKKIPAQVFQHDNRLAVPEPIALEFSNEEKGEISKVIEKTPSYLLGSRLFQPDDTIVHTKHGVIGGNHFSLLAGPCSVESENHIEAMAAVVEASGASYLRGGAFKPRTSPYSFQGLEEDGLRFLRKAADRHELDVITEVMDVPHVEMVGEYTDIFQIGARNMQNFSLLKAVGKTKIPVALKRGLSATIDDVLNAAEYIASEGNNQIILVERGIRTFDNKYTRNTFDLGAVPVLQKLSHYPVIVDPSHATGEADLVLPMAHAGVASGANGLFVEIHDNPKHAFSDGPQALLPPVYLKMAQQAFQLRELMNQWEEQ